MPSLSPSTPIQCHGSHRQHSVPSLLVQYLVAHRTVATPPHPTPPHPVRTGFGSLEGKKNRTTPDGPKFRDNLGIQNEPRVTQPSSSLIPRILMACFPLFTLPWETPLAMKNNIGGIMINSGNRLMVRGTCRRIGPMFRPGADWETTGTGEVKVRHAIQSLGSPKRERIPLCPSIKSHGKSGMRCFLPSSVGAFLIKRQQLYARKKGRKKIAKRRYCGHI